MIGRLTGRLLEEADGSWVVDVGGVGYDVTLPLGARGRLTADPAGMVTIYVHTHVREDTFQLFGFTSPDEREAFRTIIGIANVGPKLGMSILGSVTVHDLATVVARGEVARLTAIPGVGKKTAERLVLELKGKLQPTAPARVGSGEAPAPPPPPGSRGEVVASALTRMGFRPTEAERAVATLGQSRNLEDFAIGELVRDALAILSR